MTVTGAGAAYGEPGLLTAEFGVQSSAPTVGAALDSAGAAATRMRDALVRAGLAQADLQTSNATVSSRTNDKQEVTGYTVNQGLTAKVRDLPKAGALMSSAIAAGGDAARLNGVSFSIEDDTALLAEARRQAFADARGKAELYATAAGRQLGRVVRVSESAPSWGGGPMAQDSMAASGARFVIEPGRQRLSATVTVQWAFQR
ncbi:SIMPL domain-containing protein [Actinoplanes sp. NPDC048796]|uniref:SIMPL domain-containing protein n=1 Tax=Actinoplanes sp. NPDC048796 TaxID=3155640 RepID=UPI0033DF9AA4